MKKLIAVLLIAVPMIGNAESIAYTINKNGGKIVLTNDKCGNFNLYHAYTSGNSTNSGSITNGCWFLDEFTKQIIIQWEGNNTANTYDFNGWVFNEGKLR